MYHSGLKAIFSTFFIQTKDRTRRHFASGTRHGRIDWTADMSFAWDFGLWFRLGRISDESRTSPWWPIFVRDSWKNESRKTEKQEKIKVKSNTGNNIFSWTLVYYTNIFLKLLRSRSLKVLELRTSYLFDFLNLWHFPNNSKSRDMTCQFELEIVWTWEILKSIYSHLIWDILTQALVIWEWSILEGLSSWE